MKLIAIILLLFTSNVLAEDCTNDGEYHWSTCYGLQHAIITVGAVSLAGAIHEKAKKPVAAIACGTFIALELHGDGGLFMDTDRFMDWALPCTIGAEMGWGIMPNGIAFWRRW